jgi:hypothetical protein
MILLFVIFWNVMEAVYEGLYDNGKRLASGIVEAILKAVLVLICMAWFMDIRVFHFADIPYWKLIVGFVFVRYFLFDAVYNKVRGLKLTYVGSSKLYDRILQRVGTSYIVFTKVCAGIVGTFFLLGIEHL